jgi:hypothetical protein
MTNEPEIIKADIFNLEICIYIPSKDSVTRQSNKRLKEKNACK